MIEPTETESPQTLEALAESLERIADEAATTGAGCRWPSSRTTRRCGGWTRPGRPAPWSRPSTPDAELGSGNQWTASSPPDSSTPTCKFHKYVYEKSRRPDRQAQRSGPRPAAHHHRPEVGPSPHQRAHLLPRPGRPHRGGLQRGERPTPGLAPQPAGRSPGHRPGRAAVIPATARVADPEEQAQLWPLVNRTNRGMARIFHRGVTGRYDVYQRHT